MERRAFIHNLSAISGILVILPEMVAGNSVSGKPNYKRYFATTTSFPETQLAANKRIPLGWPAFRVDVKNLSPVHMKFNTLKEIHGDLHFRITAAIDIREEVLLEAFLPVCGETIASLDIKYAHPFQPFETPVENKWLAEIIRQGLGLRMIKGTQDAWFFQPDSKHTDNFGLQPQLISGTYPGTKVEFFENLYSMNSFSPFGWMGGCVIDALLELSRKGDSKANKTLQKHLACFLDDSKGIIFENPMTEPMDGRFNSIEDFLPFAAIASHYPEHPSVQMAVDYCLSRMKPDGLIASGDHVTTEGCYTLAYPLAQIAILRNDRKLADIALNQLVHRIRLLSTDDSVYQRNDIGKGTGFKNWGRGITWYVLGMAKTIHLIGNSSFADLPQMELVKIEFVRAMKWVYQFQNENGMWCSFVDKPETMPDTTVTAGIASAIAWGVQQKLLPETDIQKAEKALKSLHNYLTADGFLTHVSQINRGGEALQSNGYRVISQFALGLMSQLECKLS